GETFANPPALFFMRRVRHRDARLCAIHHSDGGALTCQGEVPTRWRNRNEPDAAMGSSKRRARLASRPVRHSSQSEGGRRNPPSALFYVRLYFVLKERIGSRKSARGNS